MKKYYMIIENIVNPIIFEIKLKPKNDNYDKTTKNILTRYIPERLFKLLCKNGLYCNFDASQDKENNYSPICIHRIVSVLYHNGKSKEIHHINKNVSENSIYNLVPLDKATHDLTNNMRKAECEEFSRKLQIDLKNSYKIRNTLASNPYIADDVIKYKVQNMPVKAIAKLLKRKIKKNTVYKLFNRFFYANEFFNSPFYAHEGYFTPLNGIYGKMWSEINKYDELNSPQNQ